ncbi:unconventional myosin-X-like [Oscarella lobularis]|uniref:unconventional myosin-X-like n=1 Tax=Oscarella lobularis TaxID=121494 RepID=UPI0033131224
MAAYLEPGSRVWLAIDGQWEPAITESNRAGQIAFKTEYGKSASRKAEECTRDVVTPMHETSVVGVDDMATLSDLHEAAILFNIRNRYNDDRIYTFIGSILAAVNPYKSIDGLYGKAMMEEYNRRHLGEKPPHVYAIANEVYYSLWRMLDNQCVLISGESGAGKTESTKFILGYLSELSQQSVGESAKGTARVETAILQSSPILEALGNAKTVYNNNSSRFGKFIQLQFNEKGFIEGGRIADYLLEKNRVVRQNPAERNYHIFYALLCGADEEMRQKFQLLDPGRYHYLNQSGCVGDPSIDDAADFERVKAGMLTMQFSEENINDVFQVLAGILHLGNIQFVTAGGAQIEARKIVQFVAHLLSLDVYQLEDALTKRMMVMRGEEITTPLDVHQAADSRDSMAMALYATTFRWVLKKINSRIHGNESFRFIGVLDIFGFENFTVNRFEQFNINFANEKLQEYFNKHIFSLEQHEYNKEGIQWVEIDWVDNTECLDLIEKKLGILDLLDEESRFPKGTDQTFLTKLHSAHAGNSYYVKPRVSGTTFGIKHYAGEVMYDTVGLLDKNRDTFRDDILNALKESRSDFIYDLFEHMEPSTSDQKRGGRSRAKKKMTVSSQFKDSLHSLMSTLSQANPYFVRCIKPNGSKVSNKFEPDLVMSQLRYSGMMETVRIRRAGFPVRRLFADFIFRYRVLARGLGGDPRDVAGSVAKQFDESGTHWQLGKTKIFLRENLETLLEKEREKQLDAVARIIQAWMIGFLTRKRYLKTKQRIVVLQKVYRGHFYRKRYLETRRAIIVFQKFARGWSARKLYQQLLEERRLEEERLREEERRREEERQRELERLEEERKTQELEEMKARLAEEERQKKAALELKKRKAEEESKKAVAKAKEIERYRKRQEEQEREARERAEESIRMAEEAARAAAEEAERLAQEETARLEAEAEQAAISQIAELDSALRAAEEDSDEEEGEVLPSTLSVSGTGMEERRMSELPPGVEDKTIEGYLTMKAGSKWKRRWCVLKFGTFMYFRAKQDFVRAGWMEKKGGGTGTLSRRNWKKRFFVLRDDRKLSYYEKDEEGAKLLGVINIAEAKDILEHGPKANSLGIEVIGRTYHIIAESEEDCRGWVSVLKKMQLSSDDEVKRMKNDSMNPRNAVGTLDLPNIESCAPLGSTSKPTSFTIITTDRVLQFIADTTGDMNAWVSALQPTVFSDTAMGPSAAIEKGWLIKESVSKKLRTKRYFVLNDQGLDYYKSTDTSVPPVGQILLNSLCTVYQPDEPTGKDTGFVVNSRRRFYKLTAKSHSDAQRWVQSILDVIDSRPPIITPTEKLIDDIKDAKSNEINAIYRINPILCYTSNQLKSSLLPLPYGNVQSPKAKSRGYGTLQEEALRIFNSLQDQESVGDPIPVIQGILQTCFDLPQLRNEVYCQLIKQTNTTQQDSIAVLRNWQVLACMCSSFLPARKFLRYLRFHLKRFQELFPHTEMVKFSNFCTEAIKRTRPRDYPPSREEIIACLGRRELTAVVHCFGGGTCKISINSSTTAGEVVHKLSLGIGVMDSKNRFALFEQCGELSKAIEDRAVIADILAKFERYEAHGINEGGKRWRLFFKLFCFLDVNVSHDSLEAGFMFEQAYNDVIQGRFPAQTQALVRLAALRIQHDVSDYKSGAWIPNLETVYPVKKKDKAGREEDLDKGFTLKGTLRGLGKGTLRKLKNSNMDNDDPNQKLADEAELQAIKVSITDQWKKLKGMSREVAQQQYMDVIRNWKGYGSTLFDVDYKQDNRYPKELWLAVNNRNVALYKRGDLEPIVAYPYEQILSFGAPVANTYKLIMEGNIVVSVETPKVLEVAKLMKAYINAIVKERRNSQMPPTAAAAAPTRR